MSQVESRALTARTSVFNIVIWTAKEVRICKLFAASPPPPKKKKKKKKNNNQNKQTGKKKDMMFARKGEKTHSDIT